jgi:hypothetical protein
MIDLVAFIFGLRVSDWHTGRIGIGPALRDGEDLFFFLLFFFSCQLVHYDLQRLPNRLP